jgi:hypothetical protein
MIEGGEARTGEGCTGTRGVFALQPATDALHDIGRVRRGFGQENVQIACRPTLPSQPARLGRKRTKGRIVNCIAE